MRCHALLWTRETYTVRRISQHLKGLNRIFLQGAVEYQEPTELQTRLHLFTRKLVDLKKRMNSSVGEGMHDC